MTTPAQQVIDKCKAVMALASEKYGVNLSQVGIRLDLKGRAAGMACRRGTQYYMRFNRDMMGREAFDHLLNNTVPHEIAHIVCMMNPALGRNHDSGWERVCVALGGSGATRHKEEVVNGKGYTYEYTTTLGHKVRVGDRHHKAIQGGSPVRWRHGKGITDQTCAYSIVGYQGRTLENPIVKKAANHPSVIEQVINTPVPPVVAAARTSFTIGVAPAPVPAAPTRPPMHTTFPGASKAAIARSIMLTGKHANLDYETVITRIMQATGHDRQLARATYKANAHKVGITL